MKNIVLLILFLSSLSFSSQKKVDLIIHNATIYTVNKNFSKAEAMAVHHGKIVGIGTNKEILKKFTSTNTKNISKRPIYPGFIDAHAHFYGYGKSLEIINLRDTKSWEEIVQILKDNSVNNQDSWIVGRGWDQNDWDSKTFPTKEKLDQLFPNTPVFLTRIDGHAAIVNQKALDIAGFNENTVVAGGDLLKQNGKLTGVLIDNAKDKVSEFIPSPNKNQIKKSFQKAEKNCFAVGLTGVVDAGLDYEMVNIVDEMHKNSELKMRLNMMLSDSDKNIDWLIKKGIIKTERLKVNGFKFYGDGALGSRGACLLEDYHDQKGNRGLMLSEEEHFRKRAKILHQYHFQMNTHAIGDSANRVLLKIYAEVLKGKNDRRWRIEHAQVVSPKDFEYFGKYNIVPSVQPTHATSDMYWAGQRLGEERLKSAYAYQKLLKQNQWLPLGADFPIEEINPLLTFYAAVARKDSKGFPDKGFQKENALTREEALRGMTIWAAKGSFDEKEKGSLEIGKFADFVIFDKDIMQISESEILSAKVKETFLNGESVYSEK